eukprot:tig00000070_g24434.t1
MKKKAQKEDSDASDASDASLEEVPKPKRAKKDAGGKAKPNEDPLEKATREESARLAREAYKTETLRKQRPDVYGVLKPPPALRKLDGCDVGELSEGKAAEDGDLEHLDTRTPCCIWSTGGRLRLRGTLMYPKLGAACGKPEENPDGKPWSSQAPQVDGAPALPRSLSRAPVLSAGAQAEKAASLPKSGEQQQQQRGAPPARRGQGRPGAGGEERRRTSGGRSSGGETMGGAGAAAGAPRRHSAGGGGRPAAQIVQGAAGPTTTRARARARERRGGGSGSDAGPKRGKSKAAAAAAPSKPKGAGRSPLRVSSPGYAADADGPTGVQSEAAGGLGFLMGGKGPAAGPAKGAPAEDKDKAKKDGAEEARSGQAWEEAGGGGGGRAQAEEVDGRGEGRGEEEGAHGAGRAGRASGAVLNSESLGAQHREGRRRQRLSYHWTRATGEEEEEKEEEKGGKASGKKGGGKAGGKGGEGKGRAGGSGPSKGGASGAPGAAGAPPKAKSSKPVVLDEEDEEDEFGFADAWDAVEQQRAKAKTPPRPAPAPAAARASAPSSSAAPAAPAQGPSSPGSLFAPPPPAASGPSAKAPPSSAGAGAGRAPSRDLDGFLRASSKVRPPPRAPRPRPRPCPRPRPGPRGSSPSRSFQ